MESKFQPGDLVRHRSNGIPDIVELRLRGPLLLVECLPWPTDINHTWHALGPRGMVSVWESNLTLISREEK